MLDMRVVPKACSFFEGKQRRNGSRGEGRCGGLGEVEGGETAVKVLRTREE